MFGPFAVCRTADIPAEVIDRFIATTYAYAEELAPGVGPLLTVLGDSNNVEAVRIFCVVIREALWRSQRAKQRRESQSINFDKKCDIPTEAALSTPTGAGTAATLTPLSFIDNTPTAVSEQLGRPTNRFFIIMDKQSTEDDTVVLAYTAEDGQVDTVRDTFSRALGPVGIHQK